MWTVILVSLFAAPPKSTSFGRDGKLAREFSELPLASADASPEVRASAQAALVQLEKAFWRYMGISASLTSKKSFKQKTDALERLEDGYFSVIEKFHAPEATVCAWLRIGEAVENLAQDVKRVSPPPNIVDTGPEGVESYFEQMTGVPITDLALEAYERAQSEATRLGVKSNCAKRASAGGAHLNKGVN